MGSIFISSNVVNPDTYIERLKTLAGKPKLNISQILKYTFITLYEHIYKTNPEQLREFITEYADDRLLGSDGWLEYSSAFEKHEKENPVGDREGKLKSSFIKTRHQQFLDKLDMDSLSQNIINNFKEEKFSITKNIKTFGKSIGLSKLEMKILYLIQENEQTTYWQIRDWLESLIKKIGNDYKALSIILNVSVEEIRDVLLGNTNLFKFNLLKKGENNSELIFKILNYEIDDRLKKIINIPKVNMKNIEEIFFPNVSNSKLSLSDYDETIPHEIFEKLIKNNKKGTNILLWGKPGTGKTEYAGALAKKMNYKLIRVGESETDEKKRSQRLGDFVLAQKFYSKQKNVVLLFDELEDLTREDKEYSKLFFNNLLENALVPTIFTANSIYRMESSFLRRMTYTANFKNYSTKSRLNIWKKYSNNLFDEEQLAQYAKAFDITPWDIQRVCEIMKDNPNENITKIVQQIDCINNYGFKREFKIQSIPKHYDVGLVNTNIPVQSIVEKLTHSDKFWNMMLTGPSGTGKSQLVNYVADQMNKQFIIKKPSDLLSAYWGETEQNIAEAFDQAYQENAILLIDEAESFLTNKDGGKSERFLQGIANEFLVQMQARKCCFAITTNYEKDLDQAFLRRFQIKLKFDYMTAEQKLKLFKMYWNREPEEFILNEKYVLAPGDFETVNEFIDFGASETPENLLKIESENKKEFSKTFGFHR